MRPENGRSTVVYESQPRVAEDERMGEKTRFRRWDGYLVGEGNFQKFILSPLIALAFLVSPNRNTVARPDVA